MPSPPKRRGNPNSKAARASKGEAASGKTCFATCISRFRPRWELELTAMSCRLRGVVSGGRDHSVLTAPLPSTNGSHPPIVGTFPARAIFCSASAIGRHGSKMTKLPHSSDAISSNVARSSLPASCSKANAGVATRTSSDISMHDPSGRSWLHKRGVTISDAWQARCSRARMSTGAVWFVASSGMTGRRRFALAPALRVEGPGRSMA